MSERTRQIRQGDVLLLRVTEPAGRELVIDQDGLPARGLQVAGERTGHAHELAGEVYEAGERRFVLLRETGILTHQEHHHLAVPAGWWEVRIQREYVPRERRPANRWD